MRALTFLSAAVATLFCGGAAPAGDADDEAVARARAELARRIEAAGAGGAIAVRGEPQSAATQTAAPQLRNADTAGCLTMTMLARTEARLGGGKAEALDKLRADLLSEDGGDRTGAELALARAYLVLGFTEEAHAIAAARNGAEPAGVAGLAMLAGGVDRVSVAAVRDYRACGGLYDLILEAADVLGGSGRPLSGSSLRTLSGLPQPLRQPIAEALAVNALGADETAAKDFLEIGSGVQDSSASSFVNAVIDRSEAGAATLAALGATPGPYRADALNALGERLEPTAPGEMTAAFESDAAETVEAAPLSRSISALNIALADRRIARGDVSGAARALGAAYRHDQTRAAAIAKFGAMTRPLLKSELSSERVSALAALALEPELAAKSLPADDLRLAAASLADLGAGESLAGLLSAAALDAGEETYFKSRALVQEGRIAEARAAAGSHANDARIATLLLQTAFAAGDADFAHKGDFRGVEPSVVSGAFWRAGDISALMGLASAKPLDAATAKRIVFAFLAARKAPPASLLPAADETGALATVFMESPKAGPLDLREIERLAERRQTEIAYLRAAVVDE